MVSTALLLAVSSIGVDFGWQPIAGGGYEWIIQIAPDQVKSLSSGEMPIRSELTPAMRKVVRSYRVVVGTGKLPNQGKPLPVAEQDSPEDETQPERESNNSQEEGPNFPFRREQKKKSPPKTIRVDPQVRSMTSDEDETSDDTSLEDDSQDNTWANRLESRRNKTASGNSPSDESFTNSGKDQSEEEAQSAWGPLMAALMGLFLSIGGNVYLVWLVRGLRERYLSVVSRLTMQEINRGNDSLALE